MKKILFLLFTCISFIGFSQNKTRPNIVFIIADDMGYSDLGCYGNPFNETPNIDSLAKKGIRFSQGYSASPVCSPSRASLLTGKNPARLRFTNFQGGERKEANSPVDPPKDWVRNLPKSEVTIAEKLFENGYNTAMVGKWHVGGAPWEQGFHYSRMIGENSLDFYNYGIFEDSYKKVFKDTGKEYMTDKLTNYALEFLDKQDNQKPFFLYLAYSAPHVLIVPRADKVSKYLFKYEKFEGKYNPYYGAMVESIDDGVGALVKKLKESGQYDNTIFVFTSDNGGLAIAELGPQPTVNEGLRKWKGFTYEGGIKIPMIVSWPNVSSPAVNNSPLVNTDYFNTFTEAASLEANTSLDSKSFLPILKNSSITQQHSPITWHYPHFSNQTSKPSGAYRKDNLKIVRSYETDIYELYDIEADPSESKNLARKNKKLAKALNAELTNSLKEMNAQMPTKKNK